MQFVKGRPSHSLQKESHSVRLYSSDSRKAAVAPAERGLALAFTDIFSPRVVASKGIHQHFLKVLLIISSFYLVVFPTGVKLVHKVKL